MEFRFAVGNNEAEPFKSEDLSVAEVKPTVRANQTQNTVNNHHFFLLYLNFIFLNSFNFLKIQIHKKVHLNVFIKAVMVTAPLCLEF